MPNVPLATIAKIRMGVTLRGRDATRPDPHGSYRLVQISDLADDGTFLHEDFLQFEPNEPINAAALLQPGDILFPNRGLRTTAAVFAGTEGKNLAGAQFYIIRCQTTSILPQYLAWTLRTTQAARYFNTLRKGTLVQTLQRCDLEEFPVPLPPIAQQQKIIEVVHLAREAHALEKRLESLRKIDLEETLLKSIH